LADGSVHDEDGRIVYRDPEMDPDTGTLKARADFPNEGIRLVGGLYGKIMVPRQIKGAMLIPDVAIQRDLKGPYALIVNAENKVESRYIRIGVQSGTLRIVEEGLTLDDAVIVNGLQRARPGIPVNAEQAATE
jgi:multidrug efflux pump subunit AcrA (membrane-fusion protein)